MTPEQLAALKAKIDTYYNEVAQFVPPQYAFAATLGKLVADEAPELVNDVSALFDKEDPTAEEEDALAQGINTLLHPETA
jgi:hypothetical protein